MEDYEAMYQGNLWALRYDAMADMNRGEGWYWECEEIDECSDSYSSEEEARDAMREAKTKGGSL